MTKLLAYCVYFLTIIFVILLTNKMVVSMGIWATIMACPFLFWMGYNHRAIIKWLVGDA
jgi:hypothetical protein